MPKKLDRYEFIWKAIQKHGYKYDYRKVNYINNSTKVLIIDRIFGEFWQKPNNHLIGQGHPKEREIKIWNSRGRITTEEFIKKAILVHGDKYNYSKVEYKNNFTKSCITCPKHGEFWQTPDKHLNGQGCPKCKESKLEQNIRVVLDNMNIEYNKEYSPTWIKPQRLDFYLPEYDIVIECQGKQHILKSPFFNKHEKINIIKKRDEIKYNKCKDNKVKIIYYVEHRYYKQFIKNDLLYNKNNTFDNINDIIKKIKGDNLP